jgi:predicted kinase
MAAALANFAALRDSAPGTELAAELDSLEHWTRTAAPAVAPLMLERRSRGFVRDGHGDLHAGNIVRWRGRLVPFDCIEFNPALRCLDVVNDVAFLLMDLQSRGRGDLGQVFLNEWLAATGDYAALRLLPFHVVYLSLVRAKVDALQMREASADRSARLRERIDHHLQLAQAWARPSRRWLMLMHGVSGSGKSWLAERLAPLLPAVRVRADVERKRLAGLGPADRTGAGLGAGIYAAEFSDRTYARLRDCADAALGGGQHVIVDATFLEGQRRLPFRDLAAQRGTAFLIVHCEPPLPVCEERVRARLATGRDASEAGPEVLADQLARAAALRDDERRNTVVVDEATPVPAAVARRIAEAAARPSAAGGATPGVHQGGT